MNNITDPTHDKMYYIGAALFVGIGSSLANGGPLSLLLGFIFWCVNIYCVAQCQVEMVTLLPIDGSFIRFAGRFVDESWGMAAGYNCTYLGLFLLHVHHVQTGLPVPTY